MKYINLSILLLVLLFINVASKAQTPQYAYTAATSSNSIPLGSGTSYNDYHSQWIYLPGDLGSTILPGIITTIYFRVASNNSTVNHIYNNFEVSMGQSSVTNLNTGYQTGLSVVYPANTFSVTGPLVADQWIPITLTTPFYFDPAQTLIVDITHGTKTSGGFTLRAGGSPVDPAYAGVHTQRYGKITTNPTGTSREFSYQFGVDIIPADRPNNAGLGNLVGPINFCTSTQDIQVELKNNGTNKINTVQIDWLLDGIPQTPYTYSGTPIPSLLDPGSNTVTATIGTGVNFGNAPRTVKAWTTLPNGNADTVNTDDTMTYVIQKSLIGDYYVGGTNPDFVDVKEAVDALNVAGICGAVNFIIRDGTYTDAGVINGPIAGSAPTNRVTFKSESGIAANVMIDGVSATSVFGMDNVSYTTIKDVTLRPAGTTAITIGGTTTKDSIVGCILTGPASTSTTVAQGLITCVSSSNYKGDSNVFIKNTFENSISGLYLYSSSSNHTLDNIIDSNVFVGQNYTSAYVYYMDGTKIRGNIVNMTPNTYGYGMYVYRQSNNGNNIVEITDNDITNNPGTYGYSAYFAYITGDNANRNIIARNKLHVNSGTYFYNHLSYYSDFNDVYENEVTGTGTYGSVYFYYSDGCKFYNNTINLVTTDPSSTTYGTYFYNTDGAQFFNNTINVNGQSPSAYGCYFYNSSSTYGDNLIRNNIFASVGNDGVGLYWSNSGSNNSSDYNNIYAKSGNHFSNAGTEEPSLNQWRLTQNSEKNSICYDPGLIGGGNLHPDPANEASWSLNGRGVQMNGNNLDKDGNIRQTDVTIGVPDIGAYEFTPTTTPPLAEALPSTIRAGVNQVFTFGQDTVITINWSPNSVVSNTIEVRQYSGLKGPSFPVNTNNMFFYTDVNTQNVTANYTANVYYHDNWLGNISSESNLRMLKKLDPEPWVAYNEYLSNVETNNNYINADKLTSTGLFTGLENGNLFSAVIVPMSNTTFCPGGSIEMHAKITSPDYTYQWYHNGVAIPGATDTFYSTATDGDYKVAITRPVNGGNETTTSNTVAVTKIPAPNAAITVDGPLVFCSGGQRTLVAAPGAGLSYQWQMNGFDIPGATNDSLQINTGGSYTVSVSNIGCSSISSVTTINAGPIKVNLGADTSFCESNPLVLDAGYTGAHYLWSTGDTTKTITVYNNSGDYSVIVDGGVNCEDADTINVQIDPLPSVVGISYIRMNASTFQFSPSGVQDVNNYTWIFSDGTVDFDMSPTHTYGANDPWEVTLVVANDCGFDTTQLDLRSLSVAEMNDISGQLILYPNPAKNLINIKANIEAGVEKIVIINNLGQVVYTANYNGDREIIIDVAGLPVGNYILKANTSDSKVAIKKFNILR